MQNEVNDSDEKEVEIMEEECFADMFEESLKGLKEGEVEKREVERCREES